MSERWKMNRIGFVNFWLYDEEDYEFADGKLLLRGQNGSGKSITTQSFIPFVLDGDRTPSRLDPFGSSDRRMEYYFIGEEGKDESTGYLYLEFKKADSEEYRTIGIGQRAKRGKPMDFWGFVILDGRRIGTDMKLYKEVGSNRIPYDRREMKAVLGEGNFFTDSQSEYKKHVNQYIFGFRKADQYEQFIRLLVKVRAPKLSKEFKPTKVYEILNDSLQTLTDEDLRAMVDAMEKMDEIQDSLEMLNRAFADVKIIRTEYTRYNQYMLAKKAQAYIRKKGEVEKAQQALEVQKQEIQYKEEVLREKSVQLEKLEEQRRVEEAERNGLLDMKLEEIDHKLEYSRGQKEEAVRNEKRWDEKIREYQERIWDNERELKETQDALELKAEELGEIKEELDEQQETLQWEQHVSAVTMIENNEYQNIEEISRALMALKKLIEECKNVIGQYEELSRQYDEITSELEILRGEKEEKEQNLRETQEQIINSIDQWIVDTYELADKSAEWKPDRELLKRAEEIVREYQSVEDADAVQGLFRTDYEAKRQKLLDLKNSKEYEKKIETEHLEEIKEELHCIKNQEELEPQRDEETEHTRMVLQEMGITTVPFYKTVEFADGMTPEACARLEAQLQKMGILDTLVVSEKDFVRIKNVGEEFLDTVLYIEQNGESKCDCLTVRENLSPELKKSVQRILTNIYEEETGQGICLGANGWFRLGVLAGRADKTGEAEFVGILARQKRKEQKIQELELLIHELEEQIADTENEIARFQERLQTLNDEYQRLPDFSAVNTAQEDIADMLNTDVDDAVLVVRTDAVVKKDTDETVVKNTDSSITDNQSVSETESLSDVLAAKVTAQGSSKNEESTGEHTGEHTGEQNHNTQSYGGVADSIIQSMKDSFADIVTEDTSRVSEADIVNQVIDQIKLSSGRELTSIEVMLNPERLGSVHVTVTAKNGILSAQIAAQNEQVKTALENQVTALKENFQNQGIKVEAVEITVMTHQFEAGQNFGQNESERKQSEQKINKKLNLSDYMDDEDETVSAQDIRRKDSIQNGNSSVEYMA